MAELADLKHGKFSSIDAANIAAYKHLSNWLRQFGKSHQIPPN